MITVYHNPRCTKSRQALAYLENKNLDFEVIKYLDHPLSKNELEDLLTKLNIKPISLIRKNEATWKETFKGRTLSDTQIIEAMIQYPKLMERPIVVKKDKAIIARPTENIDNLI
ncbi:arsenate reductase (glutaredoxin) [Spongiivirga sp. MCCC 1A20706]|uniref:arsenate reductase (glutaredoxin) n=1 Tax=Spongiivirga sp. MCCC 1A20706 TaxID=3160963 RepID=UPI0039777DBA